MGIRRGDKPDPGTGDAHGPQQDAQAAARGGQGQARPFGGEGADEIEGQARHDQEGASEEGASEDEGRAQEVGRYYPRQDGAEVEQQEGGCRQVSQQAARQEARPEGPLTGQQPRPRAPPLPPTVPDRRVYG